MKQIPEKIVFILGAGCSKDSGAPLMSNFLDVANVSILADGKEYRGRGRIAVGEQTTTLNVVLLGDEPLPSRGSGSYGREDSWLVAGIFEEEVSFWLKAFPRNPEMRCTPDKRVYGCDFSIDRVCEISIPVTPETLIEVAQTAEETFEDAFLVNNAEARLKSYKVIGFNEGTDIKRSNPFLGEVGSRSTLDTFLGSFRQFDYALIQDGDDCRVFMRTQTSESVEPGDIQKIFQLLLEAVAFAHGQNAWPVYQVFHGEGTRAWATPPRRTPTGVFPAITEAACYQDDALKNVIEAYISTMLREDEFSSSIQALMHLAREAFARTVPFNTGLLGLCAVMESTALAVSKELIPTDENEVRAFDDAKLAVLKQVGQLATAALSKTQQAAIQRFGAIIKPMKYGHPKIAFTDLLTHLRIPEGCASAALKAWNDERHPRAHGTPRKISKITGMNKGRIGGMLNAFFLAAIGYKGKVLVSPFEDIYVTLK